MKTPNLETPFGSLEVNLWPTNVVLTGLVTVNRVEYSARIEFTQHGNSWTFDNHNHLYLNRTDGNHQAPFPFKAREKFTEQVLNAWKNHYQPEWSAQAKEERRQKDVETATNEIKDLETKLAAAKKKLADLQAQAPK